MKTLLLSFNTPGDRDNFISFLNEHTANPLVGHAVDSIRLDPPVKTADERHAALYVSGTRMMEGTLPTVEKMFKQECSAHNAKVEIKELKNGEWQRIRVRTKN
jgi:hypothetical protein